MQQTNTFYKDLAVGQATQSAATNIFKLKGFAVSGTPNEYFPDYDIAVQSANCYTCKVYFIEVKDDVKSNTTQNIAIEQYKYDKSGNKQDSGLSISKADVWLVKAANSWYSISTKKLKQLLKEQYGNYSQIITKDNKAIALLPIDFVKKYFKVFQ